MYVRVHVVPGARKERLVEMGTAEFEISVREPAERNMANRRVTELLALHLGIPHERVRILTGHRSRSKMYTIDVEGLSA